jgi:hypothetical protein
MFTYLSPESRVPAEQALRGLKRHADTLLRSMSAEFDPLCADTGRPSIPPERRLKVSLLIALYSVRSELLRLKRHRSPRPPRPDRRGNG